MSETEGARGERSLPPDALHLATLPEAIVLRQWTIDHGEAHANQLVWELLDAIASRWLVS